MRFQKRNGGLIQSPVRVILLEPEKQGNIGAVARSMKNFDLDDLWIVNPKAPVDGEARAYAMRGIDILESARTTGTLQEALSGTDLVAGTSSVKATSTSNMLRVAITPDQLADRLNFSKGTVAIVFGRESAGLSNKEIERCDFMVTIPASPRYNVLNIGTAASIIFYELFRRRAIKKMEVASRSSLERLISKFDTIVEASDLQSHKRRLAQRAFRNVISRSFISRREASLLLGVFRKALSKLM